MPGHNVPAVSRDYLVHLREAFDSISRRQAEFIETDGNREYTFGDFSIITSGP